MYVYEAKHAQAYLHALTLWRPAAYIFWLWSPCLALFLAQKTPHTTMRCLLVQIYWKWHIFRKGTLSLEETSC